MTLSHYRISRWQRLWPQLEQIDSPMPELRNKAVEAIWEILPAGMTLAEFISSFTSRAWPHVPWWQLSAAHILDCYEDLLSPAGREFCRDLSDQVQTPTDDDAQMLLDLEAVLNGDHA